MGCYLRGLVQEEVLQKEKCMNKKKIFIFLFSINFFYGNLYWIKKKIILRLYDDVFLFMVVIDIF